MLCHYGERHYAECYYVECHYAEGIVILVLMCWMSNASITTTKGFAVQANVIKLLVITYE
jgi:hypothetical protein